MIGPDVPLAYAPAALALNLTPGADMVFYLGQRLRGGPRTSIAASMAISAGAMVHVAVAGMGLGASGAVRRGAVDGGRLSRVARLVGAALGRTTRSAGCFAAPGVS